MMLLKIISPIKFDSASNEYFIFPQEKVWIFFKNKLQDTVIVNSREMSFRDFKIQNFFFLIIHLKISQLKLSQEKKFSRNLSLSENLEVKFADIALNERNGRQMMKNIQ